MKVIGTLVCFLSPAAKSLQSCPTLCDPIDGSPPGFPVPGILQARTLEWVAISFSNTGKWKVKAKSLSCVWLLATPWTAAYQTPLSMGFSRQEYWSGLPLPSPIHGWREFISFWCPWSYEYWIQYCALEGDQWPHVYHKMVQYDLKNDVFIVTNQETKNEHRNLKVILYWLLCSIQINWYFNCKSPCPHQTPQWPYCLFNVPNFPP